MRSELARLGLALAVTTCLIAPAFAAGPAGAGNGVGQGQLTPGAIGEDQLRTQQRLLAPEESEAPTLPEDQLVTAPPVVDTATANGKVKFKLMEVTFDNSAFLKNYELMNLANPYIGTTVSMADIAKLTDAINDLYQQKGLVTDRAVVPPQKIKDGVLHIQLVEGKVGDYHVTGNDITDSQFFTDRLTQKPGDTVDPTTLQTDLAKFNRTYDIQARAALQPGNNFGLTDIQLSILEPKADVADLFADNEGFRSTGTYEGGFYYRHTGFAAVDDHLTAYFTGADGTLDGTLNYDIPFNDTGGRVGATFSRSETRVVSGAFSSIDSTGQATNGSLNLVQPIWVTGSQILSLSGSVGVSEIDNDIGNTTLDNTRTLKGSGGLSYAYTGSSTAVSAALNALGVHASFSGGLSPRNYNIFDASAQVVQNLNDDGLSASFNGQAQISPQRGLPSDTLFQIGGVTTVRGFTQGFLAGDDGYYVQLQLNQALPAIADGLTVFTFADHGLAVTSSAEHLDIFGAGGGVSYNWTDNLSAEISAAIPLNDIESDQPGFQIYGRVVLHVL